MAPPWPPPSSWRRGLPPTGRSPWRPPSRSCSTPPPGHPRRSGTGRRRSPARRSGPRTRGRVPPPSPNGAPRSGGGADARHIADGRMVGTSVERTPLRLLVLGDSIGYGTGALRAEDTLGRRLTATLTAEGFDVDL